MHCEWAEHNGKRASIGCAACSPPHAHRTTLGHGCDAADESKSPARWLTSVDASTMLARSVDASLLLRARGRASIVDACSHSHGQGFTSMQGSAWHLRTHNQLNASMSCFAPPGRCSFARPAYARVSTRQHTPAHVSTRQVRTSGLRPRAARAQPKGGSECTCTCTGQRRPSLSRQPRRPQGAC